MGARVIVAVDRAVCLGNQMCVGEAPDHFQLDDDGRARVVRTGLAAADLPLLEGAEALCPTGAITVHVVEDDA